METSPRSTPSNANAGLGNNLRHMVDEIDVFLKSAATSGDQKFDAVRDKLVTQVNQMREQLDQLEEAAAYRVKRAARQADEAVHSHPYAVMGIAAATGVLIGFLAARR